MYIDVEILFRIANGQILLIFDRVICLQYLIMAGLLLLMSYCDHLPFVVRPSVRSPFTPLNDFSSDTLGQFSSTSYGASCLREIENLYKSLRKHACPNILKNSPPKTESFQIKILIFFSYFCSKHRLWVPVRTASARRFQRVPTIYVFEQK